MHMLRLYLITLTEDFLWTRRRYVFSQYDLHVDSNTHTRTQVILKRTVGVKKDEFFLDGRHISKSDVTALLESAGFSRSNPYYIVMQGKVNKLCHMKDRERLDLLKEVAGTSVYEKRREESKKIMRETNARRTKIDEVITYIEKRLSELEEEKEELNKYQNLDKQRRALEYTLYDMDFRSVGERLEQIKELRVEESTKANALHQKLTKSESEIEIVDQELQSSQRMMEDMSVEIKTLEDEYTETMQMRTAAELDVSELENQFEASNESQERLRKEQRDVLVPQIEKTKKTISSDVEPKLQDAAKKLETIRKNAKDVNQKIQSYYDKIGRGKLFESEKERDVWIRKELEMLRERESEARDNLKQAQRNFENVKKDLSENAKDSVKMLKSLQALDVESGKLLELLQEKRGTRSSKIEERRTLWKKMQQFGKQKQLMSDEMQRAKRAQAKSCPRNLLDGLAAVRRVAKEKKLKGVLGPLIENFTLKSDKMLVCS
jgi:structural maintenance of chromosome 3 (chondroitin sulfate proteoglycan 6)